MIEHWLELARLMVFFAFVLPYGAVAFLFVALLANRRSLMLGLIGLGLLLFWVCVGVVFGQSVIDWTRGLWGGQL